MTEISQHFGKLEVAINYKQSTSIRSALKSTDRQRKSEIDCKLLRKLLLSGMALNLATTLGNISANSWSDVRLSVSIRVYNFLHIHCTKIVHDNYQMCLRPERR